ncbi:MAG TPA: hypothetical protein VFP13_02025 [Actinomycetota bacterium]|nr:hypothetical protein [Actinomycetota bacterium]
MNETKELLRRGVGDFEPTPDAFERVLARRDRKRRNQRVAAGVLGIAVFALAAVGFVQLLGSERTPASDPAEPFLGTWVSTSDPDGGTQTMTVEPAAGDAVEIVLRDEVDTVCSGTPSTMTGTGRIEGGTQLVIPSPVYTCDDGSEPEALSGPPLAEQLRDWTLDLDPQTDTLSDGVGGLWVREGAEIPEPVISGGMWPQTSLNEVRQAQERADAGDPDYAWQVGPRVLNVDEEVKFELFDRFLREVLGWESYRFFEAGTRSDGLRPDNSLQGTVTGQRYLRCAPGRTNPLYPDESCAPTLDDLRYETVSVDIAQLGRQGRDGIWVVSGWRLTAFAQADPAAVEAQATEHLEEFLAARVAGDGAEGYVEVYGQEDVPLLYATTSGAAYERYEIERVGSPLWPDGWMTFSARLFAEGDATVVEQRIVGRPAVGFRLDANSTTENGQPIVLSYTSSDGEVTVSAPSTWSMWWPEAAHVADVGVWFGMMDQVAAPWYESGENIGFVDPVAYDAWCADNGGSPLLTGPADAATIAQQVIADPKFETTAPVAARVGGMDAVSMDVALAPGGETCGIGMIQISRWIHELWDPGLRLRLYLVDLPEGMSVETLAITVVAPEERFEAVIDETAPIIESIEFHAP